MRRFYFSLFCFGMSFLGSNLSGVEAGKNDEQDFHRFQGYLRVWKQKNPDLWEQSSVQRTWEALIQADPQRPANHSALYAAWARAVLGKEDPFVKKAEGYAQTMVRSGGASQQELLQGYQALSQAWSQKQRAVIPPGAGEEFQSALSEWREKKGRGSHAAHPQRCSDAYRGVHVYWTEGEAPSSARRVSSFSALSGSSLIPSMSSEAMHLGGIRPDCGDEGGVDQNQGEGAGLSRGVPVRRPASKVEEGRGPRNPALPVAIHPLKGELAENVRAAPPQGVLRKQPASDRGQNHSISFVVIHPQPLSFALSVSSEPAVVADTALPASNTGGDPSPVSPPQPQQGSAQKADPALHHFQNEVRKVMTVLNVIDQMSPACKKAKEIFESDQSSSLNQGSLLKENLSTFEACFKSRAESVDAKQAHLHNVQPSRVKETQTLLHDIEVWAAGLKENVGLPLIKKFYFLLRAKNIFSDLDLVRPLLAAQQAKNTEVLNFYASKVEGAHPKPVRDPSPSAPVKEVLKTFFSPSYQLLRDSLTYSSLDKFGKRFWPGSVLTAVLNEQECSAICKGGKDPSSAATACEQSCQAWKDKNRAQPSAVGMSVAAAGPPVNPSLPLRKGVPNLNNTCYYNSIFQFLASLPQEEMHRKIQAAQQKCPPLEDSNPVYRYLTALDKVLEEVGKPAVHSGGDSSNQLTGKMRALLAVREKISDPPSSQPQPAKTCDSSMSLAWKELIDKTSPGQQQDVEEVRKPLMQLLGMEPLSGLFRNPGSTKQVETLLRVENADKNFLMVSHQSTNVSIENEVLYAPQNGFEQQAYVLKSAIIRKSGASALLSAEEKKEMIGKLVSQGSSHEGAKQLVEIGQNENRDQGGHYVFLEQRPDQSWVEYDDERVTVLSKEAGLSMLSSSTYKSLFYQKKGS